MEHPTMQFFLAALVVFVFGMAMLLAGWLSGKKRQEILYSGEEVTGTVSSITRCLDDDRYQFEISYRTRQNQEIKGKWDEFHSWPFCKKHPVGSHFQVVYLPDRPAKFVVKGFQRLQIGFVFMSIAGVGLILLSIFILVSGLKFQ